MDKKTKVKYMGKEIKWGNQYGKQSWLSYQFKRLVRLVKMLLIWSVILATIWGVFHLGGLLNPAVIYTKAEVIKEVKAQSPVLQRIAGCESQGDAKKPGTQFDKNGQVLMRSNTNKSVDVGRYQINTVWFAKATELGLDITLEADNQKMAEWIYENRGTGDWSASASCWKK